MRDRQLAYTQDFIGLGSFVVEAEAGIPAGGHQARMGFDYDGGGTERAPPSDCTWTAGRSAKATPR